MAYPGGGGPLCDSRVSNLIKEKTGIKYARKTKCMNLQNSLLIEKQINLRYSTFGVMPMSLIYITHKINLKNFANLFPEKMIFFTVQIKKFYLNKWRFGV